MPTLTVDFHDSVRASTLQRDAIASLQANQIEPKFLYVTPRQTALWREVSQRHAPIHTRPDFARIYQEAFARLMALFPEKRAALIGLGCGTGFKEREFFSQLQATGRTIQFTAIDAGADLVLESAEKLTAAGARHERSLVCDLAETAYLEEWLGKWTEGCPRLITFFGLVPNLAPSSVVKLFRAVLRPGDILLASVHLVSAKEEGEKEIAAAMKKILPQYDNPETRAWLGAALASWDLERWTDAPEIQVGQVEEIPAFLGLARWKSAQAFEKWGHCFQPDLDQPLRVFSSLRYTCARFDAFLQREGWGAERLALTSCGEEAIWMVRG